MLGISINMITIKPTNSLTNPNGSPTGGSVTSEMNCKVNSLKLTRFIDNALF